jgi:hypothetical protein
MNEVIKFHREIFFTLKLKLDFEEVELRQTQRRKTKCSFSVCGKLQFNLFEPLNLNVGVSSWSNELM